MSHVIEIKIPDLGEAGDVQVVEVLVSPGDQVEVDQGLVTLESEKATMDVPSTHAGTVKEVKLEEGDSVTEGDVVVLLEPEEDEEGEPEEEAAEGREEEEAAEREEAEEEAAEPGEAGQEGSVEPEEKDEESEAVEEEAVEEEAAEEEQEEEEPEPEAEGEREPPAAAAPRAAERARARADEHSEIVVVGGGPGGYTAAFRAADLGRQVTLVERYPVLGGVCLNVGCIPSKALLHAAKVVEDAASFADRGIVFGDPEIHLERLRDWKQEVVDRLTGGLAKLAKQRQVRVIQGEARFVARDVLRIVGDEGRKDLSFDRCILAVGSRVARLPELPYEDPRLMDSTDALELPEIPERLLLVGGGIIGLEMAMVYGALGSKLTVVELLDGLMPGTDRDLVRPLEKRLRDHLGAAIHLETRVAEITPREEGLEARFEGDEAPEPQLFGRVLVAVGRRPNGDRLDAGAAGVEVDAGGYIRVDSQQRTNVDHIFAIGDLCGEPLLAHKASHQGRVAAEAAAGERSHFDARVIPSVAYTDPEVAWVGLTETEAREEGVEYEKATFPWAASGRSLGMGRDEGLTKLLFDPGSNRVLGGGVVGPHAGDLIAEIALAVEMDCEAADLGLTIHPHPTLSETISFAADAFEGTLTELYKPKRKKK